MTDTPERKVEREANREMGRQKVRDWWAENHLTSIIYGTGQIPEATFLGQDDLKDQIRPFFKAERFPHTLLTGVPGTGKTELARWIANRSQAPLEEALAPISVTEIPDEGFVLIDEAHRQKQPEPLFALMGGDKVTVTILAATTRPELLDAAFRSRFFLQLHISRYSQDDMRLIVKHLAAREIDEDAVDKFASASAGNPRQAERIMETANLVNNYDPGTVLSTCRINGDGLTITHLDYLAALGRSVRPSGLTQLSLLIGRDETSIREAERLLVDLGLVQLTSSGRTLTVLGKRYPLPGDNNS